jgi:hypothetical protein
MCSVPKHSHHFFIALLWQNRPTSNRQHYHLKLFCDACFVLKERPSCWMNRNTATTGQFSVVSGPINAQYNSHCLDWGSRTNLVAYGCETYVVIVDPFSLKRVQTLDAHPSCVVQVKWYVLWKFRSDFYKVSVRPYFGQLLHFQSYPGFWRRNGQHFHMGRPSSSDHFHPTHL